jgi:glyoxylase-like metal-dependent hydrolase (beta-lactamase superfamily II)
MTYLTEMAPQTGVALPAADGIRRIVANNPGPMTYHGTNTYLLDGADGVSVLDPGPDDPAHVAAVLREAGKVVRILVSHGHLDHVGALAAMRAATGAPVFAFDAGLSPDRLLRDGDVVAEWTVLHTPGHAPDHLSLARADGVVMTADHVMGWSSSVVSPPEGDMAAYFASLHRLLAREDRLYLPGHGPAITDPAGYARFLLKHREQREAAIFAALEEAPAKVPALVEAIYAGLAPHLHKAAQRNVVAHLLKLQGEGRVVPDGDRWTRLE